MFTQLHLKNFRSIEGQTIALAPITVLYGATSSGKSSAMYALSILRNFVLNPNQATDALFSLGFLNLGGFEACVFNHDAAREISILASMDIGKRPGYFGVDLGKASAEIHQGFSDMELTGKVPMPYALNQNFQTAYKGQTGEFNVNWNGVTCSAVPTTPTAQTQEEATRIASETNSIIEAVKAIDISPHRRGFFKPSYNPVPISPTPTSEDEVASLVINDPNLAPRISIDLDEIFGRDFRVHTVPGTATAFFQTTDKKSRMPVYLVNDGFGVNQVVYMLTKLHRSDVRTLLIEEPEIHLHPSIIRNFVRTLCSTVKDDNKQCVFATHSEQFVVSVLNCVADGLLKAEDVRCYHVTRARRITTYEEQLVSKSGQVQGGLPSFVEVELEDLKRFVSASH